MLRALRIFGILVFALLVGLSAHRIQKLYTSGKLFEQYNSDSKANVTLMVISVIGLGVLGFFEATHPRRRAARRGFAPVGPSGDSIDDGLDTANIYSAPNTDDGWHRVKGRDARPRYRNNQKYEHFWLGLLRIISIAIPVTYGILLLAVVGGWLMPDAETMILHGIFSGMFLLTAVMAWGILRKQQWGLSVGYAVAIIHLIIFPVGTAAGLILLITLVGASPSIILSPRERRRVEQARRQRNLPAS